MISGYTKVVQEDRDSVLWLQLALAELVPGPGWFVHIGKLGPLTEKAIMFYQRSRKLPVTRKPDEATLVRISQELKDRGITL